MLSKTAVGHRTARALHMFVVGLLAVAGALLIALGSTVAAAVQLLAYTPIVMTGTFTSHPDSEYVAMAMDDFILPSRSADYPPSPPDYNTPIALDTPEQAWPITGLFDHTFGRSVQIGWADLRQQIAVTSEATDDQPIIVFGYSQSAVISIHEKRRLAEVYPVGGSAPDVQFVLIGDLNRPNGGVMTRFHGAYLPVVNFFFNGSAPTNTNFETVDVARQYDGFADFPLYPLNLVSDLNALLGILYVHTDYEAVSLDPESPNYVAGTVVREYGDTLYYTIPTAALPLLQPLRDLGVPEPLMALVEPALRVVVEAGYDRTINPGVPTAARLIPRIDPVRFVGDLVAAIGEGFEDARAEIENPTPRPVGPTPTERVLTDLVRTNLDHTAESVAGLSGRRSATDTGTSPGQKKVTKATSARSARAARDAVDDDADQREVRGADRATAASGSDRDRRKDSAGAAARAERKTDRSTQRSSRASGE